MNKKSKSIASLLALFVTLTLLPISAFAVEEEPVVVQQPSKAVFADPESDYGFVEEKDKTSSASEVSFEEVVDEESVEMTGEEEVLGSLDPEEFGVQEEMTIKEGYQLRIDYEVGETGLKKGVVYLIYDTANNKFLIYDHTNKDMADQYLYDYNVIDKDGITWYNPKKAAHPRKVVEDIAETEFCDLLILTFTEEAYNNMSRDWMNPEDLQFLKAADGSICYFSSLATQPLTKEEEQEVYEYKYNALVEAERKYSSSSSSSKDSSSSSGKDSSSSSGKDSSSSSSGKDSSSSSGKDDSSSSGKDSSSSSAKDDSSSSSKEDSSSSAKDDSSSSTKDDSSSSAKDDTSSSDANVTAKTVKVGAASYEVKSTKQVDYDGRKHVAVGMKETAKQIPDIKVTITRDGKTLEPGTYKLKFKNNSAANGKTPSYKITLGKGYDKAEKKAISKMSFAFDIAPLQVEAKNFTAKKPATVKDGKIKVKLLYKLPNGKLLTLKKGTYTLSLNGDQVTITTKGNLEGTVTIPLKQLQ